MITKLFTNLFSTLEKKPQVGITTSFTGWILGQSTAASISNYDVLLKFVTQASIFIGFTIGIVTLILKLVELYRMLKNKNKEPNEN